MAKLFIVCYCCVAPLRYPCTVCGKSVRGSQSGLLCDSCGRWSHTVCIGISTSRYDALTAVGEFNWQCPSCLFAVLPSSDVSEYCDELLGDRNNEAVDVTLPDVVALPIITDVLRLQYIQHNFMGANIYHL